MRRFVIFGLIATLLVAACAPARGTAPAGNAPAGPASAGSVGDGYARPELLAETDWLKGQLGAKNVRLVDLRSPDAYKQGHLPGAVQLDGALLKDPDDKLHVPTPENFKKLMESVGIGNDTLVVAYDDNGGLWGTRLWWALDYYGNSNAKVLNGGWNKWKKEGLPTSTEPAAAVQASFTPKVNESVYCAADYLERGINRPDVVIVDARSAAEYNGSDVRAARGGHVPNAVNIDWVRNVTADDVKVWRPASELRKLYTEAGVTPDKEVITYCQTAVRAAHSLFTLRLIGFGKVRNFDGSWAEWGNNPKLPISR